MVNITNENLEEMVNTGRYVFTEWSGVFSLVILAVVFVVIVLLAKRILK